MSRLQANLFLFIAAGIWGSTFAVQQVAMDHIGPMAFTAARFLLGALAIAPFAFQEVSRKRMKSDYKPYGLGIILGISCIGALLFTGTILQQIGIMYTTVTNAGFLTGFYVVLVPALGFLIFQKIPHWSIWPAGAACVVGAFLLSGAYKGFDIAVGDVWVIGSTIFWALHVLMVGFFAQKTNTPIRFAAIQFFACGVISAIAVPFSEEFVLSMISDAAWHIVYAGVVSVGIAFTLQVIAQGYAQPADAALILSLETVFAALTGAFFLGEVLSPIDYLGCSLILFAVLAVELLPILKNRLAFAR